MKINRRISHHQLLVVCLALPLALCCSPASADNAGCLVGAGAIAFDTLKSAGFPNVKSTLHPALVSIVHDDGVASGFQSLEIVCNAGKPVSGVYFSGNEPSEVDKALTVKLAKSILKPWISEQTATRIPELVTTCLAARPKDYNSGGLRDGFKVTAGTIEMWCDGKKWDVDDPKSAVSTEVSFGVVITH